MAHAHSETNQVSLGEIDRLHCHLVDGFWREGGREESDGAKKGERKRRVY